MGDKRPRERRKEDKEDTKTYEGRKTEHEPRKESRALRRAHVF